MTGVYPCGKEIVSIDVLEGCKGTFFNLLTVHMFHALTQAHAMSDLCRVTGNKSRNITTLLAASSSLPLPTDLNGRGDKLISFRAMAYVQANIFLVAPCQTPKDSEDLFQRATSSQESIEEAFKSDYNTNDVSSHPDYRKELQALLSTYYEDVLDMKGASGVVSTRPLALCRMPQKQTTDPAPADPAPAVAAPVAPPPTDPMPASAEVDSAAATPPEVDKGNSQQSCRHQINPLVLDERCAVVFRNGTAIQLQADFIGGQHSSRTRKNFDRDMQGI